MSSEIKVQEPGEVNKEVSLCNSPEGFDKLYQEISELVIKGRKNIYISGPGGCGKSYIIKKLYQECLAKGIPTGITSTTGVSAHSLGSGARTIHSWGAIKLGKSHPDIIIKKIMNNKQAKERWTKTEILIIDEISMCSSELFEYLDIIAKEIRLGKREMLRLSRNNITIPPFGGLQIIASGDFLQLPPVNGEFIFQSKLWKSMNFKYFRLTHPYRYPDPTFFEMLLRAREGKMTDDDIEKLRKRVVAYNEYKKSEKNLPPGSIKPTKVSSLKKDVEAVNLAELDSLEGDAFAYEATDVITAKDSKNKNHLDKVVYSEYMDNIVSREILLKPGAQVMLTVNLSVDDGLVNGSRGIIEECCDDQVKVKFKSGLVLDMKPNAYEYEDEIAICVRYQFPLILAWSATTHKIQGSTLDSVIIDLGTSLFCPALGYVALSRCRTLEGIYINNIIPDKIKADPIALEFDKTLETQSTENL